MRVDMREWIFVNLAESEVRLMLRCILERIPIFHQVKVICIENEVIAHKLAEVGEFFT